MFSGVHFVPCSSALLTRELNGSLTMYHTMPPASSSTTIPTTSPIVLIPCRCVRFIVSRSFRFVCECVCLSAVADEVPTNPDCNQLVACIHRRERNRSEER